jgi:hypothetical protein
MARITAAFAKRFMDYRIQKFHVRAAVGVVAAEARPGFRFNTAVPLDKSCSGNIMAIGTEIGSRTFQEPAFV